MLPHKFIAVNWKSSDSGLPNFQLRLVPQKEYVNKFGIQGFTKHLIIGHRRGVLKKKKKNSKLTPEVHDCFLSSVSEYLWSLREEMESLQNGESFFTASNPFGNLRQKYNNRGAVY